MLASAASLGRSGKSAEALELLETVSAELATKEDPKLHARVLREIGLQWRTLGDVAQSRAAYERALAIARACGSGSEEAFALNGVAVAHHVEGDLEIAEQQYAAAARLAAANGLIRLSGMIEQNRGVIANIQGDLPKAARRYRAALAAFQMTGDHQGSAWVLNNLGMLSADEGDHEKALQSFENGRRAAAEARDVELQARLGINMAEVLIEQGSTAVARRSLAEALEDAAASGFDLLVGEAHRLLSRLERLEGDDVAGALDHAESAIEIARDAPDRLLLAESLREAGESLSVLGRGTEARVAWGEAADLFEALGASDDVAMLQEMIGPLE